jgi:hypothetical protein
MNKQRWIIIGSLGLFLLLAVMALLAAENPVSADEQEPQPVRAPAPVVVPRATLAPASAASAASLPAPEPVPVAPGSAAMADGPVSAAGASSLLLTLFVGTVGVSFGFLHFLRHRQAGNDHCVPHQTLAQGVQS